MPHIANSGHIYALGDGKFRLTFVSTSPGGASFLCELGDFTKLELTNWLQDHLHPATDFAPIVRSLASGTEFTLPVGHRIMNWHFEDGELVKSPATGEAV